MPKLSKRARKYRKKKNGGEKINVGLAGTHGAREKSGVKEIAEAGVDTTRAAREGYCEDDFE